MRNPNASGATKERRAVLAAGCYVAHAFDPGCIILGEPTGLTVLRLCGGTQVAPSIVGAVTIDVIEERWVVTCHPFPYHTMVLPYLATTGIDDLSIAVPVDMTRVAVAADEIPGIRVVGEIPTQVGL
jgi:hypothetical protein